MSHVHKFCAQIRRHGLHRLHNISFTYLKANVAICNVVLVIVSVATLVVSSCSIRHYVGMCPNTRWLVYVSVVVSTVHGVL